MFRRRGKFAFDLMGTERIRRNALQAIPFWVASLLTGFIAVGYTKLFGYSEGLLKHVLGWHLPCHTMDYNSFWYKYAMEE